MGNPRKLACSATHLDATCGALVGSIPVPVGQPPVPHTQVLLPSLGWRAGCEVGLLLRELPLGAVSQQWQLPAATAQFSPGWIQRRASKLTPMVTTRASGKREVVLDDCEEVALGGPGAQ